MKRSKSINLTSMRKQETVCDTNKPSAIIRHPVKVAVAATLSVTGCSSGTEETDVFRSLEDCNASNPGQEETCQMAYDNSQKEAERTAPKYSSLRDCEDEFGYDRCRRHSSSGVFMPMMAGFMIGRMLDGGYNRHSPMFTSYSRHSPYYGNWVGADGRDYGSRYNSKVYTKKSTFEKKPTATKTMSRGGFGSRAAAKSSWSGSRSSGWGG